MKKNLIIPVLILLMIVGCAEEKDPFLIGKGSIGLLSKDIKMKQLDSIFANDSIVKLNPIEDALGTQGEVEVYDKGGAKLMLISPDDESDPESLITNIQIFDDRYKTDKGLSPAGTFADIKANYEIAGVENAINSVVIFLQDSDVFITIDKKHLPEDIRYNYSARVEATQIPESSPFKYFMVGWDAEESMDAESSDE